MDGGKRAFGKPHPAVYLSAAAALGVPPAECVAIEDSANGLRSARAAGMRVVAVPDRALAPAELVAIDVLRSLRELPAWLDVRMGETGGIR